MTHEQKPESAEFRTREEQVSDLAAWLTPYFPPFPSFDRKRIKVLVNEILSEAEARGAAEQRHEDLKEYKSVGYLHSIIMKSGEVYESTLTDIEDDEIYSKDKYWQYSIRIEPVYTHPAKIGDLEARITSLTEEMDARIAEAVAAERQRCAAICDALADEINDGIRNGSSSHDSHGSPAYAASSTAVDLSEAIRNPNEIK